MPADDEILRLLKDSSLSQWLRDAMVAALERDPNDAANDAGLLSLVLDRRAQEIAARALNDLAVTKAKNG